MMIPLYSGEVKFINHLHLYKDDNPVEDIMIICDSRDALIYCAMDRINFKIKVRTSFPYSTKLTALLSESFPHITFDSFKINKIMGLYDKNSSVANLSTVFFVVDVPAMQEKHLVQANIRNHDPKNAEFLLVEGHQRTKYIYLDMLVKKQVLINDTSSSTDIDTFLMYIKTTDPSKVANMYVEGVKLLVRQDEIVEFKTHHPDVTLPTTMFPIVDVWSKNNIKFFQLTQDTSKVKFNFSTGLGFLDFLDEEGM